MVPISSRSKSNNIVAGNKLNSHYLSFYSLRSRRAASWPRGAPRFAWSYFAPQRVARLSQSHETATTTILD